MNKKLRQVLSVLLSLIIIISATPVISYAADKTYEIKKLINLTVSGNLGVSMADTDNLDIPSKTNVRDGECEQGKDNVYFSFYAPADIPRNSSITLVIDLWEGGRYKSFGSIDFDGYTTSTFTYNYSQYNLQATFKNTESISKGQQLAVCLKKCQYFDNFVPSNNKPYCMISRLTLDVNDEKTGKLYEFFDSMKAWFNSLFQWLKDIRDNITNGFNNIGSWITDLSNSVRGFFSDLSKDIKSWFNNLTNDLKTWFSDIGKWFTQMGDRISGFFSDLWNDLSSSITNITVSVSDWWQGVIDWFHSLFVPEDGFFDEYKTKWDLWLSAHFGFLYESVELVDALFSNFESIKGETSSLMITIPQLKLPWNNMVILNKQKWNMSEFVNSHTWLQWLLTTFKVLVSALMFYALLLYGKKTFSELLGMEGEE